MFHVEDVELIVLCSELGLKLRVLLGFLAGVVWKCLFFSFDNTDCVILYPIKAARFDPSCFWCAQSPAGTCLVSLGVCEESRSTPATHLWHSQP